ncbi:hypothetical protein IMZ48_04440, partial [Candidatus Bathyarchaeota archaeon]|nr:hypothetical protein [Candidatus Bathyarchaeota archaeon]
PPAFGPSPTDTKTRTPRLTPPDFGLYQSVVETTHQYKNLFICEN